MDLKNLGVTPKQKYILEFIEDFAADNRDDKTLRNLSMIMIDKLGISPYEFCNKFNVTTQHFYRIRKAFDEQGTYGIVEKPNAGGKPVKITPDIEKAVIKAFIEPLVNEGKYLTDQEVFNSLSDDVKEKVGIRTIQDIRQAHGLVHLKGSKKNGQCSSRLC